MPLNIDLQQICLHLFNFTLLLASLYFLLYQPVKDFMAKREAYYADMEHKAQEALDRAREAQTACEEKLAQADEEIHRRGEEAQRSAAQAADARLALAEAEAGRILERARADAQAERQRAAGEARREVSDMVMAAVEKLVLADTAAAYDQFLTAAGEGDGDA